MISMNKGTCNCLLKFAETSECSLRGSVLCTWTRLQKPAAKRAMQACVPSILHDQLNKGHMNKTAALYVVRLLSRSLVLKWFFNKGQKNTLCFGWHEHFRSQEKQQECRHTKLMIGTLSLKKTVVSPKYMSTDSYYLKEWTGPAYCKPSNY